jgi:uncharacterized protein (TIGR03437 family)
MCDPFAVNTTYNFSSDPRTRIMLFASNLVLNAGENSSVVTVQARDSQGTTYPLTVEFVGAVPGYAGLTEVVVKFPDQLPGGGNLWVSISLRGVSSNQAFITMKP